MERSGDFASLLEELIGAAAPAMTRGPATGPAVDFLAAVEETLSAPPLVSPAEAAASYRDVALEEEFATLIAEKEREVLGQAPPLAPEAIASELGLDRSIPADLTRLRRDFALRNHPDRAPEHLREHALKRMQIANALIDEAAGRQKPRA